MPVEQNKVDVVIIGSGPSATSVATNAAEMGKTVAMAEERQFGGTCALRGCNPKKVYVNAGSLADQVRHANGKLIQSERVSINWSDLHAFKQQFTKPVAEGKEESLAKQGIQPYHGTARFVDERSIQVGSDRLIAERIFVGVGSRPARLDIEGEEP